MNGKKRITKILAMIICLIFCTNQAAVYGAELVSFSDGVEEQGEVSSAGIEKTDSSETEEEVSAVESPGDSQGTEISEEDFSDTDAEKDSQDTRTQNGESENAAEVTVEDEQQNREETVQEENTESEKLFISEETRDVFSAEAADIPVYPNEISQDIYWQDNNEGTQAGRLGADEYAEWFYKYGKVEVTYENPDGTSGSESRKVSELLRDAQEGITMEDLQGTGHYVMYFAAGSLNGNIFVTGNDGKPTEVSIQNITLLPPDPKEDASYPPDDSLNQNYQFLNIPDETVREQYTSNQNIGFGWYYIKKMDFTAYVEIRSGSMTCGSNLTDAVRNELHLQYQKKNQDADFVSEPLQQVQKNQKNLVVQENPGGGSVTSMDITVSGLPQYRIDGTEILYAIREAEDMQDNRLNSYKPGNPDEEDYFSIDYNNTDLSNHGTDTTAAYNGGTVILTLRGIAEYQAEKEWKDKEDNGERPEVSFTLWRYSKRGNVSYRQASQVKNKEGDTLKYVIPADSAGDSHKITFAYTENLSSGSVCLADEETLPKYDPEGFEYVYFTRERMQDNGKYAQVLGKIICTETENGNVIFQTKDTLPDNITREESDKSIYNGGTVSNVLTGTVNTGYTKTWSALAWQGELDDVQVEFVLQAKHMRESYGTADDNWYTVQENGADVTQRLSGFDEEMTSKSGSRSMPKYDELGHELEYRWVETGVYQGNDSANLFRKDADSANGSFVLTQKNKKVSYTSSVENVRQEDGSYHSEIVNRIDGKVNYRVVKKWQDEKGRPAEAPEGAEITLALLRQDSRNQISELGTLVLDGVKDESEIQIRDEDGNVIRAAETESWRGEFLDLPLYDKDGRWYDYLVVEKTSDAYRVIYGDVQFDEETSTYYREIINRPGSGNFQFINVRKEWIDDSDAEHRGDVTFTIYKRTGKKQFEMLQTVTLRALDFWQKQVEIPSDIDRKDILVLETSVAHTGDDGASDVPCDLASDASRNYTGEEMERIWKRYHEDSFNENPAVYYHSDEHWYRVTFRTKEIQGISYYTVTNQRLGRILLDVTKEWIDGDGSKRTELKEALSKQGLGLYAKLICDRSDVINYEEEIINTGTGEHRPVDADGNPVKLYQEISLDAMTKDQKFYFYDLPKYDKNGSVVHYSVQEVYAKTMPDGTYQEISLSELEKAGITTEYSSLTSSKYQVGDSHTRDQQHFYLKNKLGGTKKIVFHKQWKDRYRFEKGDRPDIYLNLYRQIHEADGSVKLELFYKDYLWRRTEKKDSHYYWTVDFDNLPKYDDYGYEIFYYAQEKMHVDARRFDYTTVEYLDQEETLIGNETDGFYKGVAQDTRLAQLEDQKWILGENGTFVNRLKEDVRIEGKKIWGNIPRGFEQAALPEVRFTVYQKGDSEEKECASITVSDWSGQYVNAAYRFLLEYMGENLDRIETGSDGRQKLVSESVDGKNQKLPLYDEEGGRYSYTVKESVEGLPEDKENPGKNLVFLQPVIHNFMVENFYESKKGNLTVKKILEAEKSKEETYPSVSYVLTRYYTFKDKNGKDVTKRDISFKKMLTLDYDEFSLMQNETKFASAQGTFENLEIYDPNGKEFQYVIEEKKISATDESYSLAFAEPGDRNKDGRLIHKLEENQSKGTGKLKEYKVELLYASDDKDEIPDATFKNVLSDDRIVIEGTKKWDDNQNLFGFRPSVDELNSSSTPVSFKVVRYANAQPGVWNSIGSRQKPLEVLDEKGQKPYDIIWKAAGGVNDPYQFRITGKNGELEKYAPNGMPWLYGVREVYANNTKEDHLPGYKDNTGIAWCTSSSETDSVEKNGKVYQAAVSTVTVTNSFRFVNTRIEKRWRTWDAGGNEIFSNLPDDTTDITNSSDICESAGTDYLGYNMSLEFTLQGRIKACYDADGKTVPYEKSSWMGMKELFNGSGGLSQTTPLETILKTLKERVKNDSRVSVSEDGVRVTLSGYMKNDASWKYTLQYLPKYGVKDGTYNEEGCYYELEYRLCEDKISLRQPESDNWISVELKGTLTEEAVENTVNEIIRRGNGKEGLFWFMGFFRGSSGRKFASENSDRLSVWANAFPVTKLTVTKIWDDTSNAYGTRALDGNKNWTVSFAVQRRIAALEDGTPWETSWQNVSSTDKTGRKTDVRITLSAEDAKGINSKSTELDGLPVYGIEDVNGTYQVVQYEYRARELNTDGTLIDGESGEKVNKAYAGSFDGVGGLYDVAYQDETKKANEGDDSWKASYATTVTNSFAVTVRYAEKNWEPSGLKNIDKWNYPEITLEIQYQKKDGTYQSFSKRAIVRLDGKTDEDSGLPYGEYEEWKAVWNGLPEYIPGSAADSDGNTIYRVKESSGGYYQEEEQKTTSDGETKFCFTNTLTEVQVSKTVELGENPKFNLDDRLFGFKLTNNKGIKGTYRAVLAEGTDSETVTDVTVGKEFTLKNNQTIKIYGLPVCKNNDGKNKITYYIEETDSSGKNSEYETEFRTEVKAENTNVSSSVNGKKGSFRFTDTKGTVPAFAFRNILEGEIKIIKTDNTGKKLKNVKFLLEYKKNTDESSEADKDYQTLTEDVCSDKTLVQNGGIAVTDKNGVITFKGLKLGYKYCLKEIEPLAGTQGLENPITDIALPMLLTRKSTEKIKPVAVADSGEFVYVKLKYQISNNTVTMPLTSGNGFFWPGILGLVVTGIGGAFWIGSGSRTGTSKKKGEYAK